jgi:DNA-binding CsgD family transcriptional regulator
VESTTTTGPASPPLDWSAPRMERRREQHTGRRAAVASQTQSAGAGDDFLPAVVAVLRNLLEEAELGELELEVVSGLGLASVREYQEVRCAFVVELPSTSQSLSPREMQIAALVADGATNRAIGTALDISLWTVSTHLRRIFAKLGVGSRAEMVAQLFGAPHLPMS